MKSAEAPSANALRASAVGLLYLKNTIRRSKNMINKSVVTVSVKINCGKTIKPMFIEKSAKV